MPDSTSTRTRAIVDLAAARANYTEVTRLATGSAAVLCVVKADAYGHGAVPVSRALAAAGAMHFAVATVEEAVTLREAAISGSILVLGGLEPGSERDAVAHGLEPLVGTIDELRRWDAAGRAARRKLACHLLLNTGMNRLGIDLDPRPEQEEIDVLAALDACDWVRPHGVATHYASAEDLSSEQTAEQNRLFSQQLALLRVAGLEPRYVHAANSAALVYRGVGALGSPAGKTLVRPGLALYGYVKRTAGRHGATAGRNLRPVLEWRARLMRIRDVPAGAPVGYGARYVTPRPMRLGVLSVGYGDGLEWRLSNRGAVSLGGAHCPIVGEVSMDLTVIDLGAASGAREGDEAILLGAPPYDAQGMAGLTGDSPYQVLCRIASRVRREYVNGAARR